MKILTGEAKVKKGDVQCLGSSTHPERIVIRNEADLYNREKIIQKEPLDKQDVTRIENGKTVVLQGEGEGDGEADAQSKKRCCSS